MSLDTTSIHKVRIQELKQSIIDQHGTVAKNACIVLFADFEHERIRFRQESSFYYLTGISEPGVAMTIGLDGESILWVPNCTPARSQWVDVPVAFEQKNAAHFGVDSIRFLGSDCTGYQFHPFFPKQEYDHLLAYLHKAVAHGGSLFTLSPHDSSSYIQQRLVIQRITSFVPELSKAIVDISYNVAQARRCKDMYEIEQLYKAIEITCMGQQAAAHAIGPDVTEAEIHATIQYIFAGSGAEQAFPSIVASGKNATVLHYMNNEDTLQENDLVLVDIGATHAMYCGDITRTYPVSGVFNARQKEVYSVVLELQEYIHQQASIGMWLSNSKYPDKSLHHLAKKFLEKVGYAEYFNHGIGHFLGLDVHDVGDYSKPLQEGDVFTIEPGIYMPRERIGIRIEDNYWVTQEGIICLSQELPKSIDGIEALVQGSSDNTGR